MANKQLRVISLLPSATELLCAIGGAHLLVGRSHEDNYPSSITHLPILTAQIISPDWSSAAAVDRIVSDSIKQGKSLYTIDERLIRELKPNIILTQHLCNVCAIDLDAVEKLANTMNPRPEIVSLNPESIQDVLSEMLVLGKAVGLEVESKRSKFKLDLRIRNVISFVDKMRKQTTAYKPKNIAFIEWSDPIYLGGHWTPQLIELGGGLHPLKPASKMNSPHPYITVGGAGRSNAVAVESVVASDPDMVIVCPCGLDLARTLTEVNKLMGAKDGWFATLRAVRTKQVYLVDGDAMFNRPGPRLVDALEWLTQMIHGASATDLAGHFTSELSTVLATEDYSQDGQISAEIISDIVNTSMKTPFPYKIYQTSSATTTAQSAQASVSDQIQDIKDLHRAACLDRQSTYIDPATGYHVFTEYGHLQRGKCCGNKCRHCPYGHYSVKPELRSKDKRITRPTYLKAMGPRRSFHPQPPVPQRAVGTIVIALFWSGGKDSFLALLALEAQIAAAVEKNTTMRIPSGPFTDSPLAGLEIDPRTTNLKIVLYTHFEESTGVLNHQGLPVPAIMDQARFLGLDLLLLPLPSQTTNTQYCECLEQGLNLIYRRHFVTGADVEDLYYKVPDSEAHKIILAFGDLHLEDVVKWRIEAMRPYQCFFPLYHVPYERLLAQLWECQAQGFVDRILISNWDPQFKYTALSSPNKDLSGDVCRLQGQTSRVWIGEEYNPSLIAQLPQGCDVMGENGEFHTHVIFSQPP